MKIEPRLPQLPSLGELLEHPRVKVLVQRVNRSTLAHRATGFLEEIRASLAERTGRIEAPTVALLAERLVRRLLGEPTTDGPVINATGVVLGDPKLAPPMAEKCLHALVQLAGEFHRRDRSARDAAAHRLAEVAGAEAALVTRSFDSAVLVALCAVAGNLEFWVAGADDATSPVDWQWCAARAGAVLRHGQRPPAGMAAVVQTPSSAAREPADELRSLATAGRAQRACVIDVAPFAGTCDVRDYGFDSVPTIRERLSAGAHLVVADGLGLLGGPECGLIVGERQYIEMIEQHPFSEMLGADPLTTAALDAAVQIHAEDARSPAVHQLPAWQLLSAPLANLRQRAERLAALMNAASSIESAVAREADSTWLKWGRREWRAPTWTIELRPVQGDAAGLIGRLGGGSFAIVARENDGAAVLDLRSVFPRWDQQLVAAVETTSGREHA